MIENAWNRKRLTSARCHPSIANGSERKDSQISMMERRPNPLTKFGGKKLYGWFIHDQSPKSSWASLPHVIDLKLRLKDMNLGVKGLNENEGNRSHSRDWWFYNSCRQQVVGCLPNFNTHWNDGRCLHVSNFRLPRSVEPSTNPESSWKNTNSARKQTTSKAVNKVWVMILTVWCYDNQTIHSVISNAENISRDFVTLHAISTIPTVQTDGKRFRFAVECLLSKDKNFNPEKTHLIVPLEPTPCSGVEIMT